MSYTTETITAFANLLSAVKDLQPDHSEAKKLASKLITDQANAKNQAIAAVETMKYGAFLKAQEKGNAYAIEMLSMADPTAKTDTRYFRELGGGGGFEDGGQLPLDQNKVVKDAKEYFDGVLLNAEQDTKNVTRYLLNTGMNKDSDTSKLLYEEALSDLNSMMEYRNQLYDKSQTLQNISDGQDGLYDIMPFIGSRREMKLDDTIEQAIAKQQSLVEMLES